MVRVCPRVGDLRQTDGPYVAIPREDDRRGQLQETDVVVYWQTAVVVIRMVGYLGDRPADRRVIIFITIFINIITIRPTDSVSK